MNSKEKQIEWSSHLSFILAAVGSAVGLGNIWRFPYIMGKNGGAVFLFTYLFLIAFICIIPLCVELALGKMYKKDTISCFKSVDPKFEPLGWSFIITVILIPCFYFVVGGWILNYLWIFITNNIPVSFGEYFADFSSKPVLPSFLTILFLLITAYFPLKGVKDGIEKANNIMMPTLGVSLLILALFSLTLSGAKEGLEFMFKPDFSLFNSKMVLCALGQALFTLSIGMGAIITYGSYVKKETNIVKSGYTLIFFDTLISLLSGIMIFPAVFTFNIEPTAGATLIFISLPEILGKLPCPWLLGTVFFILLFFAAVTSGISMLETSIASFMNNFNFSRKKSTVILTFIIGLLSIPASLSFSLLSDFKIFNKTFFDFLDFLTSNIMLPLNVILMCIIAGWFIKSFKKEAFGYGPVADLFNVLLKIFAPVAFIIVLIFGLNQ